MSTLSLEHFVTARAAMGRRLAARRAERFARPIHGHSFDSADMSIEVDDPPAPPIAFHLVYQDASNKLSGRNFTLRNLKTEWTEIRLSGICHFRNALRTFLASRVVEVTDLSTGEISEDGLEYFRGHPLLQGLNSAEASEKSPAAWAVQECRDEIIILSFVAASDDDFAEAEEDQIVAHVLDFACDEAVTEAEVRRRIRAYVPDELAFDRALSRICQGSGDPKALMRSLRRVVDADGELDTEEVAFVSEIAMKLTDAGRI